MALKLLPYVQQNKNKPHNDTTTQCLGAPSHSYFIHLAANYLQLGQMDQKRDSHWSIAEARPPFLSMTSHQNVKLTTCPKNVAQ